MHLTLLHFADQVSDEVLQKIQENPDKVYFPNFGGSDNIFREGITINRELLTIPGTNFKIYWYGFLIAMGLLFAMMYGFRKMKSVGIDPDRATDAVLTGFIGAIIGLRVYFIAFSDRLTFKDFFNFREGGLAIYGGIIGAILVGGTVAKLRGLKLSPLLDVVAPCFLIGQSLGRWGNFFNQEAFGANTNAPWGMMSSKTISYIAQNYDELGGKVSSFAPVHPCFLYESLWCALCFVVLHLYFYHRKFDGEIFLMYIGLYGLGRFFIEGTRTDSLYIANIKVSQLVAGACVFASVILIIVFRSSVKRSNYKFFYQTELSKRQLAALEEYEAGEKARKELKSKISEAKKKGESFAELEKEYNERFGDAAKERAKVKADELRAEKKALKEKIKAAKASGKSDELAILKNEYADKFGGMAVDMPESSEDYKSILDDPDEQKGEKDYSSEYCDVEYLKEHETVLVTWKKFCKGDDYRAPLEKALDIIKEHKCGYTADTRNGFENDAEDTKWVADHFMKKASEYGCKCIYFIIDDENNLKDELEGQQNDSADIIEFKYIKSIDEVEK